MSLRATASLEDPVFRSRRGQPPLPVGRLSHRAPRRYLRARPTDGSALHIRLKQKLTDCLPLEAVDSCVSETKMELWDLGERHLTLKRRNLGRPKKVVPRSSIVGQVHAMPA